LSRRGKEIFDLNLVGGEKKYTPIYYALEKKASDIAELLFVKGAKVCIRLEFEYLPREWKKRESNVRRHILWKFERMQIELYTKRILIKEDDMNFPSNVKKIEGYNNWIEGYTSVGSYLKKLYKEKQKILRSKVHKHAVSQNSSQKILFTINNPKIKEGDLEVEDINIDSENDVAEDKDILNWSYHSYQKKKMNDLNDDAKAWLVPKSMSVNNNDHSKGPNIFLLRDRIIGESNEPLSSQIRAIHILATTNIDKHNRVNYRSVLRDLSNNLHCINHEIVLIKTIELLQYKGSDVLVDNLNSYVESTLQTHKMPVSEAYKSYESIDLISRPYTQFILKEWIKKLKEEGLLFPVSKDRKPYIRLDSQNSRNNKIQPRSLNRAHPMTQMTRYIFI